MAYVGNVAHYCAICVFLGSECESEPMVVCFVNRYYSNYVDLIQNCDVLIQLIRFEFAHLLFRLFLEFH